MKKQDQIIKNANRVAVSLKKFMDDYLDENRLILIANRVMCYDGFFVKKYISKYYGLNTKPESIQESRSGFKSIKTKMESVNFEDADFNKVVEVGHYLGGIRPISERTTVYIKAVDLAKLYTLSCEIRDKLRDGKKISFDKSKELLDLGEKLKISNLDKFILEIKDGIINCD